MKSMQRQKQAASIRHRWQTVRLAFPEWKHSPIWHNLPMCGRYRLSRRKQIIEEHFDGVSGEEDWTPRYNIAPTQPVLVIRQHPKEPRRELSLVRWGLIPSWAKDASGAAGMINARSESAATKPCLSRCDEISPVLDSCGWFLRVVARREKQTAILLRSKRRRAVRLRRTMGAMERYERQLDQVMLDSDHDPERRDSSRPRPDAGHPSSRYLRFVARSWVY
jgi:hypothetical protein